MKNLTHQPTAWHYDDQDPLIENQNADAIRFKIPKPPNYSVFKSFLSVLSLGLLTGLGIYFYLLLKDQSLWITLPFLFTISGGGIGFLLELYVLVTGTPFFMMRSRFTRSIQMLRFLNISPIVTTIFFFICSFVIEDEGLRMAVLYLVGFGAFAMGTILYLGPPNPLIPLVILGTQLLQLVLLLSSGMLGGPLYMVCVFLLAQGVSQGAAFMVGTATPMKSFGFHVLSSISGVLLYLAVREALKLDPAWVASKTIDWAANPLLKWGLIFAVL